MNIDEHLERHRWLSLGAPQPVPHTNVFITPLCVRGVSVGGLRYSPRSNEHSCFDPVLGQWIQYEDEEHLITCATLSPLLEATLWRGMEGWAMLIMDGPKIGTLSPLAPAFAGAGIARLTHYLEM